MSRAHYSDDGETWKMIMWRGAVTSAIRGKRGQEFLKELLAALESMKKKELISGEFEEHGSFCTLGVIGHARGIDMTDIDGDSDTPYIAKKFGISDALAREIMFMNDEAYYYEETPAHRWSRIRLWLKDNIKGE